MPDMTKVARPLSPRPCAGLRRMLFPEPPRRIRHARLLNVLCRTVHLAAFGLLLGGHAWGVEGDRLLPALWLTAGSGVALMVVESLTSARWLLEGRGALLLLKLALLLLVPFAWEHRVAILIAVIVVASVGSHMPRRFRHASLRAIWADLRRSAGPARRSPPPGSLSGPG